VRRGETIVALVVSARRKNDFFMTACGLRTSTVHRFKFKNRKVYRSICATISCSHRQPRRIKAHRVTVPSSITLQGAPDWPFSRQLTAPGRQLDNTSGQFFAVTGLIVPPNRCVMWVVSSRATVVTRPSQTNFWAPLGVMIVSFVIHLIHGHWYLIKYLTDLLYNKLKFGIPFFVHLMTSVS
jgi:hypothetical protein